MVLTFLAFYAFAMDDEELSIQAVEIVPTSEPVPAEAVLDSVPPESVSKEE